MAGVPKVSRALLSVSDKAGLADFARGLAALGIELVSTGGTAKALREAGLQVLDVSDLTGFPEMMDGRVKTLHPKVHGALLGIRDSAEHAEAARRAGIGWIDLAVVNLYPFEAAAARADATRAQLVEQIDIGGPSMVRSAAKNADWVGVVTRPGQYGAVLAELRAQGGLSEATRRGLAAEAFAMTAAYDAAIARRLFGLAGPAEAEGSLPEVLPLGLRLSLRLRYGENPHQRGALYSLGSLGAAGRGTIAGARVAAAGKEPSFNNLLDADAAWQLVADLPQPSAVIVKHATPCGAAYGGDGLAEAFRKALETDPVSAYGGILAVNVALDPAAAEAVAAGTFFEVVVAPSVPPEALEILTGRPKWGRNVRVLETGGPMFPSPSALCLRSVSGGVLVQTADAAMEPPEIWVLKTKRPMTTAEHMDAAFALAVVKHARSNAIVLAKGRAAVGIGAGQTNRLDAVRDACRRAGERAKGAALASDAFFPFRDGIDAAAKAGASTVVQPGGSLRDAEVVQAADGHGMAMAFTGARHFRH